MSLFTYVTITQRLLQDTKQQRFNWFDLIDWINIGRVQCALEGEAVHAVASLTTTTSQVGYSFSSIGSLSTGTQGIITVRNIWNTSSGFQKIIASREWEYFMNTVYGQPPAAAGPPTMWAQVQQGNAGTIYLNPEPDQAYSLSLDTIQIPSALSLNSDDDALPLPFIDAVPYYAAYMAYLTVNDFERAEKMFMAYKVFVARARSMSVPTILPRQYEGGAPALEAGTHIGITQGMGIFGGGGGGRGGPAAG
jgi:hypothetical protein